VLDARSLEMLRLDKQLDSQNKEKFLNQINIGTTKLIIMSFLRDSAPPIFVSTSGVRARKIGDAVLQLATVGFRHIELSGGTTFYPEWLKELLEIKKEYDLTFRLHNYFPPPPDPFVLNLAAEDVIQYRKSFELIELAIEVSEILGSSQLGFHAGFLTQVNVEHLGREIPSNQFHDLAQASARFHSSYLQLKKLAMAKGIALHIENNVLSRHNHLSFGGKKLLMMTTADEILTNHEAGSLILLDLAHLKVTCSSLGLSFRNELSRVWDCSNYLHLSDNDGTEDQNRAIEPDSEMFWLLAQLGISNKSLTLEIYDDITGLEKTYEHIRGLSAQC